MATLVGDRRVDVVAGAQARYRVAKVAAGVRIFKGALIARDRAGFVRPAQDIGGWKVLGVAQEQVDNTSGTNGAQEVKYLTAVSVRVQNDSVAPVTQAQLYGVVYVKDDQTVQAVSPNGVVAGVAESIELDGTIMLYVAAEVSASTEDLAGAIETVTTAVALSVFAGVSLVSPTGTMAMPLAAGRYSGQRKLIRMIGGAATPIANVAGAFTTDGVATTTAQFNATGDLLDLVWNGTAWQVLNNVSVVLA